MEPDATPAPLTYGRSDQPSSSRVLRVAAAFLIATIVFAIAGPPLWGRYLYVSRVRSLQSQCLQFTASASQIIYDTDKTDRDHLLAQPGYRPFNRWAVFTTPPAWHDFRGSYACPDGTAFLHGRQSTGEEKLVAVDLIPTAADVVWLRWSVSDRVPLLDTAGIERSRKTTGSTTLKLDAHGRTIRLYAGQIDPNDLAAFTIEGSFASQPFAIDGRLMPDGPVDLRPHPAAAGEAAVVGVSCDGAGPSGPGSDLSASSSACTSGKP